MHFSSGVINYEYMIPERKLASWWERLENAVEAFWDNCFWIIVDKYESSPEHGSHICGCHKREVRGKTPSPVPIQSSNQRRRIPVDTGNGKGLIIIF